VFFTIVSGYQPSPPNLQHILTRSLESKKKAHRTEEEVSLYIAVIAPVSMSKERAPGGRRWEREDVWVAKCSRNSDYETKGN
jgi:hypothetical protein